MSFETGTFEFKLSKPIMMAISGHDKEVNSLIFHECGEGYDSYYFKLRKFINAAKMNMADLAPKIKKLQEVYAKDEDLDEEGDGPLKSGKELTPFHEQTEEAYDEKVEAITEITKMSLGQGDELENLVEVFGDMISFTKEKPICTTSCSTRIQRASWNRIDVEDKIDMAVKYCAFFGIGLDKPEMGQSDNISELPTDRKAL